MIVTEEKKNYEQLLRHYNNNIDIMQSRLLYWHRVCKKVIEENGLNNVAVINQEALLRMILCYFTDIVRVKEFHRISVINESKKYAFGAFWFLRFHPINIICEKEDYNTIFINEKVVLHIVACEFLNNKANNQATKQFISHLFHHLKYRTYTARTLELALDALLV